MRLQGLWGQALYLSNSQFYPRFWPCGWYVTVLDEYLLNKLPKSTDYPVQASTLSILHVNPSLPIMKRLVDLMVNVLIDKKSHDNLIPCLITISLTTFINWNWLKVWPANSCSINVYWDKQWNEASSFHRTPKYLSIWQDVKGMGRSRRQWRMAEAIIHFLPAPKNYFTLLHLLFSLSPLQTTFSKILSYTHNTHSLIDINLSFFRLSLPSTPSPWQHGKCSELTGLSTCHYTVFQFQINLEWSGLDPWQSGDASLKGYKVTTKGVASRKTASLEVPGSSSLTLSPPPLLPEDPGFPFFTTLL